MIDRIRPYNAYKDSGVQWMRYVPGHWEVVPIGRIGRLFKGTGGTKADDVADGVPCVRYGDLYTTHKFFIRSSRSFVTPERSADYTPILFGDVLFAGSGETLEEIGKSAVNLLSSPACCGGDVLLLRPTRAVVPEFLGYASDCLPAVHQKAVMGRGVTVMHIYADRLKYLRLPLPPIEEQTAIVRFLDHADRRIRRYIAAKKKLIALLYEQKQAIIHRAVTRGLDPNVRLKPSGVGWLGDVPEHWEVQTVAGFCGYLSYGFTNPMPAADEGPYMLTASDVGDGVIRYEGARRTTQAAFDHLLTRKSRPLSGDVLVTKDGTLGRVAIADGRPACINQSVAILRVDPSRVLPEFLSLVLRAPLYQERMVYDAGGSTIKHIYITRLAKMKVVYPGRTEQSEILANVRASLRPVELTLDSARREIDLIREYRTRLIADVVTGKLDVREAAAQLPDEVEEPGLLDDADALAEADESDVEMDQDSAFEEVVA